MEIPQNDYDAQAVTKADIKRGIEDLVEQLRTNRWGIGQLCIEKAYAAVCRTIRPYVYDRKAAAEISEQFKAKGYYTYFTRPSHAWNEVTHLTVSKKPRYGIEKIYC